jgi:hypothetical protein
MYHTHAAAGINTIRDFSPANRTRSPIRMRTALATIDFFAFVVITPNTRFRVSTF